MVLQNTSVKQKLTAEKKTKDKSIIMVRASNTALSKTGRTPIENEQDLEQHKNLSTKSVYSTSGEHFTTSGACLLHMPCSTDHSDPLVAMRPLPVYKNQNPHSLQSKWSQTRNQWRNPLSIWKLSVKYFTYQILHLNKSLNVLKSVNKTWKPVKQEKQCWEVDLDTNPIRSEEKRHTEACTCNSSI